MDITELNRFVEQEVTIELIYQPNLGDQNSIELAGTFLGLTKTKKGIYFLLTDKSAFDAEAEGVELADSVPISSIKNIFTLDVWMK